MSNNFTPLMPLEHERAKFAYNKVSEIVVRLRSDKDKSKFESWAEKFPSMVASCGLLQAVTFYEEKGKKEYFVATICKALGEWLNEKYGIYKNISDERNKNLVYYLTNVLDDPKKYLLMTKESIMFLTWVKRFASILTG
ncbi:MAG: type III-B CRISPR module-associated protein Cmr5 [archaeon]